MICWFSMEKKWKRLVIFTCEATHLWKTHFSYIFLNDLLFFSCNIHTFTHIQISIKRIYVNILIYLQHLLDGAERANAKSHGDDTSYQVIFRNFYHFFQERWRVKFSTKENKKLPLRIHKTMRIALKELQTVMDYLTKSVERKVANSNWNLSMFGQII